MKPSVRGTSLDGLVSAEDVDTVRLCQSMTVGLAWLVAAWSRSWTTAFVPTDITPISSVNIIAICTVNSQWSPLELHLTTSELWFGQEQKGILP